MKAVFVVGAFSFGGAERVICNLANYFASCGHEIVLLTMHRRDVCYELDERISLINGINHKNIFDLIKKIRKIIKNAQPNVVLTFMTHINIAVLTALIGTKIPVVVSERNDPKNVPSQKIRKLLRLLTYPFASGYVFQTNIAKEYFNNRIQQRSIVIPNPIYLDMGPIEITNRRKEIVSVGRLVPQKNQALIIKAFSQLEKDYDDYTLNFYGDGCERENLFRLISELNLEGKVFLHGETNNLHEKIRNAQIFILASDFEGMPNALMESMALGLACISTDCPSGGPAFLIDNMKSGILIPVGDEVKLVEALKALLSNSVLREALSLDATNVYKMLKPEDIYSKWREYLKLKAKV